MFHERTGRHSPVCVVGVGVVSQQSRQRSKQSSFIARNDRVDRWGVHARHLQGRNAALPFTHTCTHTATVCIMWICDWSRWANCGCDLETKAAHHACMLHGWIVCLFVSIHQYLTNTESTAHISFPLFFSRKQAAPPTAPSPTPPPTLYFVCAPHPTCKTRLPPLPHHHHHNVATSDLTTTNHAPLPFPYPPSHIPSHSHSQATYRSSPSTCPRTQPTRGMCLRGARSPTAPRTAGVREMSCTFSPPPPLPGSSTSHRRHPQRVSRRVSGEGMWGGVCGKVAGSR